MNGDSLVQNLSKLDMESYQTENNSKIVTGQRPQVDLIDIVGYKGCTVKILFEYLLGYKQLMEDCADFLIFADMLMLCKAYDIKSPITDINKEINSICLSMENLMSALEALEIIRPVDEYERIYCSLRASCVDFARRNFTSRKMLVDFVLENQDKSLIVCGLLHNIYWDNIVPLR